MAKFTIDNIEVTDSTKISLIGNPKRKGFQAYYRYAAYQKATTIGQLRKLNPTDFFPDLRHDLKKGFCQIV